MIRPSQKAIDACEPGLARERFLHEGCKAQLRAAKLRETALLCAVLLALALAWFA